MGVDRPDRTNGNFNMANINLKICLPSACRISSPNFTYQKGGKNFTYLEAPGIFGAS